MSQKHDYANYDQFAQIFLYDLYDDTKCLCTKFEAIWTNESRVMGWKSLGILKMDWCAFFAYQYGCCNINV